MRASVRLDDRLAAAARARARREGISLSALVAQALEQYLAKPPAPVEVGPFRLVTVSGGGPRRDIDLDRVSELVVSSDEAAFAGRDDLG